MNELAKTDNKEMAIHNDSATLMQAIVSMSANAEVDVGKMERLWEMKERIDAKNAEIDFNAAMVAAQTAMKRVSADAANPQTRSRYASYAALDKALRPIYTDNGFALSFDTGDAPQELYVRVKCYLSHKSGHSRTYHVDMPADGKGAKGGDVMTKTHAAGAAMSYGMRYLLKMIFNVAVGEDDIDGNEPIEKINDVQVNEILAKIDENGLPMDAFLKWLRTDLKCDGVANLNVRALDIVHKRLDSAIRAKK